MRLEWSRRIFVQGMICLSFRYLRRMSFVHGWMRRRRIRSMIAGSMIQRVVLQEFLWCYLFLRKRRHIIWRTGSELWCVLVIIHLKARQWVVRVPIVFPEAVIHFYSILGFFVVALSISMRRSRRLWSRLMLISQTFYIWIRVNLCVFVCTVNRIMWSLRSRNFTVLPERR